jgi:hypothetical protein
MMQREALNPVKERTEVLQDEILPDGITFVTEADGIREYLLANKLKALFVENRVAPVASLCVLYKSARATRPSATPARPICSNI